MNRVTETFDLQCEPEIGDQTEDGFTSETVSGEQFDNEPVDSDFDRLIHTINEDKATVAAIFGFQPQLSTCREYHSVLRLNKLLCHLESQQSSLFSTTTILY